MPFASIRIEDGKNKNSTQIRPCCLFRPAEPVSFDSIDEYIKSPMLRDLQQHLLTQDSLPSGCEACKKVEDNNQLSVRQLKNRYFDVDFLEETNIKELDLFPSNVCNLACIMCSPKFSSSLAAEQKKLGIIKEVINFDETDRVCEAIVSLPDLQHIAVSGGEFFYAKHCMRILKQMQDSNVKHVKITTNGSIIKDEHIEILKTIPELELRFSVDGTQDHYNFVRYPAVWEDTKKNILEFQQRLPNAKLEIVIVIQPLNIFSVFDWLEFANTNNIETHWINLYGDNFNWDMLTLEEKQTVKEFVTQGVKTSQLTTHQKIFLLNFIKNTLDKWNFDQSRRLQSINRITQRCDYRKIPRQIFQTIFKNLPQLQQQIIDHETSNYYIT